MSSHHHPSHPTTPTSNALSQEFIAFAIKTRVLKFGQFQTKAGRLSPYFFNAGQFHDGASLGQLAQFYAKTLLAAKIPYDMLFGPAYKGITLASSTAVALAQLGQNTPFAFNRKEAKDHGEGGTIVGAPLQGRVVIIDDVISAGTSVHESVEIIRAANATPAAVLIALDRMERSGNRTEIGALSAVEEVAKRYQIPVLAIATLADLLHHLTQAESAELSSHLPAMEAYRAQYGYIAHNPTHIL